MPHRNEIARKGFQKKDVELSKKAHTDEIISSYIHEERHQKGSGEYIGDFVYGALDGLVTTFAVVAGATGAQLSAGVILIMGLANLIADGFSMAAGNYLSKKSEKEYEEQERKREQWEIEHIPEAEREEIRQIFHKKGFSGIILEQIVDIITKNKKVWVDTMLSEELQIFPEKKLPMKSAIITFFSFLIIGFLPLVSYVYLFFTPLFRFAPQVSISLTAFALFFAGSLRSLVIGKKWWIAGLEMFIVGISAAGVAFGVGIVLQGLADSVPNPL